MNKFWDIVPPENQKEEIEVEKKKDKKQKKIKFSFKFNWGLFLFVLILGAGLFVTFRMSKSEIRIWPTTKSFTFNSNFTVDANRLNLNYEEEIIPGEILNEEKVVSEEFPSTGSVERKAEGVIRLYNAYTTMTETWLQGTRFVSEDGKFFKSKEKIVVPGAEIKDEEIVPSYVDVPVIAAEAGEEYNIDPSSFSIYVYRGTDRYTKFYGESFSEMEGGGEFGKVTSGDLESAKDVLIEKAKTETKNSLKGRISSDYVFFDNAFQETVLEDFSSKEEGDVSNNFSFTVRAKSKTISFNREKAEEIIKSFIDSQISDNTLVYMDSLEIDYSLDEIDWEAESMDVDFEVRVETYPQIDLDFLKEELKGKSLSETEFLLENQSEITEVEVNFWPFWINQIPEDGERIEIVYPIINS